MTTDHELTLRYDRKLVRMVRLKSSSMGMESLLTDTHFAANILRNSHHAPAPCFSITHVSSVYTCQVEANHHPPRNP